MLFFSLTLKAVSNPDAKKRIINNHFNIVESVATNAIKEMFRQVGNAEFDRNGIIKKGLIIRHLILPNNIENSKQVLKEIAENFDKKIYYLYSIA